MPELELGQAADERAEFIILLGWQAGSGVAVLQALILGDGGIPFWLEEEEEEVEEVDAESVGDWFASIEWLLVHGCGGRDAPMYQPCARTILRKNMRRSTTVPIQRYAVKGVEASRYFRYCCTLSKTIQRYRGLPTYQCKFGRMGGHRGERGLLGLRDIHGWDGMRAIEDTRESDRAQLM